MKSNRKKTRVQAIDALICVFGAVLVGITIYFTVPSTRISPVDAVIIGIISYFYGGIMVCNIANAKIERVKNDKE